MLISLVFVRRVKKSTKKGAKMNKKQLIGKISASMSLSKADAERQFDGITEIILNCLKNDEQVKIAGFGTYKVAKRKARVGRNPKNSQLVQIPEKKAIKWKMSKTFFNRLNKNFTENKIPDTY